MEFVNDESPHELQPESEGEGGQPLEGEVTGGGWVVAVNLELVLSWRLLDDDA